VGRKKPAKAFAKGHRGRLRARYREVGEGGLLDHELLELLLTYAIPRGDTKLLAKNLLERFGMLSRMFEAEPAALEEVPGITPLAATLLSLIRPLATRFLKGTPTAKNFLRSTRKAAVYFQAKLKGLPEEEVHVAFVNAKNAVTATVRLQRGPVDQSAVYVRQVIERALAHKANGFILAHNHPSGDPTPSPQDRELTQAVNAAAAVVGIRFLDHLIIGDTEPFSFKASGLL
jgi:DNA repair protein RadC